MANNQNTPIRDKEDIQNNPDSRIDQDFKGYPHGTAKDETIKPQNEEEEKTAGTDIKDGEKLDIRPEERESLDEQDSDGSANAFDDK